MKKIAWLSVLAMLVQGGVVAQILDQGNFIIGSSIGFSTANAKVTTNGSTNEGLVARQINIAPSFGYFILDNFTAGVGVDFTLNSVTQPNEDKTEDSDLLFGPFARYYFPMDDNIAFFLAGNFGFGNAKDEQVIGENKQKIQTNVFALGIGPGMTVYAKSGLGIEAIFKYNFAKTNFDTTIGGVSATTTTRTNQFSLSLGVQYYFAGFQKIGNKTGTVPGLF
ncbi:MAG: outer membrane beta-barrel protein [Saprospiraceae bacterium]|nr:outer membrane beta-barrel protein [Saprospiraceae bacterium]